MPRTDHPTSPPRSEWTARARAGILETVVAGVRRAGLASTLIGALFLIAAWTLTTVILDTTARDLREQITGVVDFDTHTSIGPGLAAGLVALAWLATAGVALRRSRMPTAGAIALCGLTSAGTLGCFWWSGPFTPLQFREYPDELIVLSVLALAAPVLAAAAAARAGLLQRRATRFIGAAAAAQVIGVWGLALMDPPTTIAGVLVAAVLLALAPLASAVTGASFALLRPTGTPLSTADDGCGEPSR